MQMKRLQMQMKWLLLFFPALCFSQSYDFCSEVNFSIKQSLPEFNLNAQGEQKVEAEIAFAEKDLLFSLKRLKVDLINNDEKISIDTKEPHTSFYFSQVGKLIDKPIPLKLNDDFTLNESSAELFALIGQFPMLQEIHPVSFLKEMINPLTLFLEHKGKVGKKYSCNNLEYQVVAIDGDQIEAVISGTIPQKKVILEKKITMDDGSFETVHLTLNGSIRGDGVWQRGSLASEWSVVYTTTGIFQAGKKEWLMTTSTEVHVMVKKTSASKA
jgi:hypothetical protein